MTTKEIEKMFSEQLPPAHPDTEKYFREDCIVNRLLIYDGRKNRAVCTSCGSEWDIYPGEYARTHGCRSTCPECGEVVICVSAGKGRAKYEELHRLMTFASDGKSLWIVQNDIFVHFREFAQATLGIHACEVFKINADEQKHWRYRDGFWSGSSYWEEMKSFNPAPLPHAPYYGTSWHWHIFTEGIDKIIGNSDCRYLVGEDFHRQLDRASVATWLTLQMKYPALELLRKGGFDKLAKGRLTNSGYSNYGNAINIRAKSIEKAIRLPKKWEKTLRRKGISKTITSRELKEFQKADDKLRQAAVDNWGSFTKLFTSWRADEYMQAIRKYTTIEKYLSYMRDQKTHEPTMFIDYIENAHLLGWDLRRTSILFPPDLKRAHDEAAALRDMEKNAEKDKKIRAHAVNIDYQIHDLVALPAMSQQDLNNESSALHHCVKTYGDRVAAGNTLIYFVRRTILPDEPYYTLEISPKDGHVIQCRGLKNCSMTAEVQEFKEGFEKAFVKMMKREERTCRAKA